MDAVNSSMIELSLLSFTYLPYISDEVRCKLIGYTLILAQISSEYYQCGFVYSLPFSSLL